MRGSLDAPPALFDFSQLLPPEPAFLFSQVLLWTNQSKTWRSAASLTSRHFIVLPPYIPDRPMAARFPGRTAFWTDLRASLATTP